MDVRGRAGLAPVQTTIKATTPQAISSSTLSVTVTRGVHERTQHRRRELLADDGHRRGERDHRRRGDLERGVWHLRGQARLTSGSAGANVGTGGFTVDIVLGNPGTTDDTVSWNLDAIVS